MPNNHRPFILAITGASGVQYGFRLLECLLRANQSVLCLVSEAARQVTNLETDFILPCDPHELVRYFRYRLKTEQGQLQIFEQHDWLSPVASGSSLVRGMVVCPCSCKSLSAFAHGASTNLIERAADVTLKEKRPLILVPREAPVSRIHLEHMLKLTQMGALIIPASPAFYHHPKKIEDLIDFVVAKVLDHLEIPHRLLPRWGQVKSPDERHE
jgi:4-hydroxy-3-polyprenylbenzoate decarboxylase